MSGTDYYKTLGVEKTASAEEIKRSFRKLAMEHHPDRNEGDAKAEERFKEANEAYAVLSDPEKRKQYDMFGAAGFRERYSQDDIFRSFDFSRIFEELGMGGRFGSADMHGFFQGGRGGGFNPFSGHRQAVPRQGENIEQNMTIGFHEAFRGGERILQLESPSGRENISVKIPAGITPGKKLRVRGKGHLGTGGGKRGDLFLKIQVAEHPFYELKGINVEMDVLLPISTAVLGGSVIVTTPADEERKLKVPPCTVNGTRMRVRGEGFPGKGGGVGDLVVRLVVEVPDEIDDAQRELFEALRDSGL